MPIVPTFLGITIRMYFGDHAPPHFHVAYQGFEALVRISELAILENWQRASALEPLERIPGLDAD